MSEADTPPVDLRKAANAWREAADATEREGLTEIHLGTRAARLLADGLTEAADERDRLRIAMKPVLAAARMGASAMRDHARQQSNDVDDPTFVEWRRAHRQADEWDEAIAAVRVALGEA